MVCSIGAPLKYRLEATMIEVDFAIRAEVQGNVGGLDQIQINPPLTNLGDRPYAHGPVTACLAQSANPSKIYG